MKHSKKGYYFCIDVGGTEIKGGIVDKNNSILFTEKIKTQKSSDGKVLEDSIFELIKKLELTSGLSAKNALGLGIGFPGLVDSKNGILKFIPSLDLKEYDIVKNLANSLKIPVKIANDAELALLAEQTLGSGKSYKNFALITLGTGVGSGLVIDGKALRETLPYSCELGHNFNDSYANRLDKFVSTSALISQTQKAMQENPKSKMWSTYSIETVSGKTVFDYKDSDEIAKQVFDEFIKNLGTQIVNLCNIVSPELVIIGGGISSQGENLTKPLEEYVNENMFLKIINKKIKITSAKFLNDAGFLGARCLFK